MQVRFERGTVRAWRLLDTIVWHVGRARSGVIVTIPAGREFESSVPWWLSWVISPDDPRFLVGAVVHDDALESGRFGRAQAAAEWLDGALAGGAPPWLAKCAYVAVAIWAVWRRDPLPVVGPEVKG